MSLVRKFRQNMAGAVAVTMAGPALSLALISTAEASDLPPVPGPPPAQVTPVPYTPAPQPPAAFVRPGPWAISAYAGWVSPTDFTTGFFTPWNLEFRSTRHYAATVQRHVFDISDSWWVDFELGVAQRDGLSDATELWGAFYVRFDGFPWRDWLYMTVGASTGLNYASNISALERSKNNGDGSKLLHFFSPEFTFAHPDHKDTSVFIRYHHRSGMFGVFNGVHGGSTAVTFGVRQHF